MSFRCRATAPKTSVGGLRRCGAKEFARFLDIAIKSCFELEYQLELAHDANALSDGDWRPLTSEVGRVRKMLYALRKCILDSDGSWRVTHDSGRTALPERAPEHIVHLNPESILTVAVAIRRAPFHPSTLPQPMSPKDDVVRLARKIDAALSRDEVSFGELFTDDFMRRRTNYPTFLAMCDAVGARTPDELLAVAAAVWEKHVLANTSFASWEDMQQEAFAEWLKRQVDEP